MTWAAAQAKAKFSEMLDKAEEQGPQSIQRRKKRFILLTEEQYAEHTVKAKNLPASLNAWEALRPSFELRDDIEFPRLRGGMRKVDLG